VLKKCKTRTEETGMKGRPMKRAGQLEISWHGISTKWGFLCSHMKWIRNYFMSQHPCWKHAPPWIFFYITEVFFSANFCLIYIYFLIPCHCTHTHVCSLLACLWFACSHKTEHFSTVEWSSRSSWVDRFLSV